jgi:pyruvate dehydrogenase (quinone)
MADTVGDFILKRLHEWGVSRIYGYPGDGINGIVGALDRQQDKIEFVQARHEELAAFMACGHAKFSGEVGVCLATSGPGAIHLLNGLYDAAMDHQPVVAIVGQQATTALGAQYQQEVDLTTLFKDVAPHFVAQCNTPAAARHLVDRAVRIAKAERTVTCIIFPNDIQEMPMEDPPRAHGATFSGVGYTPPRVIPADRDLMRAAEILNAGSKVAMLVGAGALQASDEVKGVADLLGAGVAKALLGRTVVADDLPYVTGAIGLLGTEPSYKLMMECDTLLMVGTGFPYSEFLPKEGQARAVQIDIKPRMLGLRYPTEVNLCGDSKETLLALMPYLERKTDRSWREEIENDVARWWQVVEGRAMNGANPINPQRVFWELSPRLPHNVIVTADSGSAANWFARDLKMKESMMASLSGNLATMGPGVPYAIAAKFTHPDRPVIACVGDGAMQMNGMNGLITIAKYCKRWSDPRLIVLVLNNRDLNQVTWEQRVLAGDPKFEASQNIPDFDYAGYAEMSGLKGITMRTPDDIAPGWDEALRSDRPVVINAYVDPEVPPLPPHIEFEQAKNYMSSLFKGEPHALRTVKQSIKGMAESYKSIIPGMGESGRHEKE